MAQRRLFGGRSARGQALAVAGAALGAAVLGYAAGSLGKQVVATRLARAEHALSDLRDNNDALESALRTARLPLQRRIHELEQALGQPPGGSPPAAAPEAAEIALPALPVAPAALAQPDPELLARIDESAARLASEAARSQKLAGKVESLAESLAEEEATREELEADNRRLAKRITELELASVRKSASAPAPVAASAFTGPPAPAAVAAAPLPAKAAPEPEPVAAPTPARTRPVAATAPAVRAAPAACPALEQADFDLALGSQPLGRLGGRLALHLADDPEGLHLALSERGARYPLETAPQHISFDCAGTPYIVSVCRIEADAASGTIWLADTWRNPCR